MANNYEYKELSIDYQEQVGLAQQVVECNIDTYAKGGVSKLLSVCADASVTLVERMDDNVKVMGNINYKVVCLNQESALESYDYVCEYSAMIKVDDIEEYSGFFARACVLDIDSGMDGDIIKLQTVCDINLCASENEKHSALVTAPENVLANFVDVGIQSQVGKVDSPFTIVEEYETGGNVDKILLFDSDIVCCGTLAQDGMLQINGEIVATVVYESGGAINTKNFSAPYSEDIVANVTAYNRAEVYAQITSSKIVLAGVEDNNVIRIELACRASGVIYDNQEVTVIDDVYSLTNELDIDTEDVEYNKFIGEQCFKDKIAGSAELDDSMVGIRKVLSACLSRNCITNAIARDKEIIIEGIMACSVIYEDTNLAINSMQVELPYSLPFDSDMTMEEDVINATSIIEILSAKIKRDREIEVTALITIQTKMKREVEFTIIQSVEVGECRENEYKAITIYQTKNNESLWSVCKEVGATKSAIIEQNPTLEGEDCARGQKIVYYRQLVK